MSLRKGDIAITVCQDNTAKKLVIESADEGIELVTGFSVHELKDMQLQDILTDSVNDQIEDYIEFESKGNDLADVLGKVRNFGFLTKLGKEMRVDMRVTRGVVQDEKPRFQLVVRDASDVSSGSNRVLKHLRGAQQLDPLTSLPNRETFQRDMEFVMFCVEKERIKASFALIGVDQLGKIIKEHGRPAAGDLLKEVATRCRMNFRTDDFLAYLENDTIAVVMLEAGRAAALIPLNRLRWQVANKPLDFVNPEGDNTPITVTVAYDEIGKGAKVDGMINNCLDAIIKAQAEGGNKIVAAQDSQ
jgi:diguanylate cyclase (GGDEF)-like protein